MPTLSIIKSGSKCAVTYMGLEEDITGMLTQCALRDELLAEAILQAALRINSQRTVSSDNQNLSLQTEISKQ
jgi:hypothetical protein